MNISRDMLWRQLGHLKSAGFSSLSAYVYIFLEAHCDIEHEKTILNSHGWLPPRHCAYRDPYN
jgi:hypothetical protein